MFADVAEADERTLWFTPGGLSPGGMLSPDDAAAFQASLIADATLVDAVPDNLRNSFERLRRRHALGVIDYEQFTEVADDAVRLYEPALRYRFVEFYHGQPIPFTDKERRPRPLTSDRYDDIAERLRKDKLYLPTGDGGQWRFSGMLTDLMRWARDQGLLRGQRARHQERLIVKMRNRLSHGRQYHVDLPGAATMEIRDLAEFINQLWGVATPGGRRYPAPVRRDIMVIGWDPTTRSRVIDRADGLRPDEDPSWQWMLLRGVADVYDVERFDSRYATSRWPAEYLWGPGPVAGALTWLSGHRPSADEVDAVDRLYLLRQDGNLLHLPQHPEVFAAAPPHERGGSWHLLRADHPNDAFGCVRSQHDTGTGHDTYGCPAQPITSGPWGDVHEELRRLQPTLMPHLPVDVRAPTPITWPRTVEIPNG